MNLAQRYLVVVSSLLIGFLVFASTASASEPTAETAKSSLAKRAYPWYDAKNDGFRPLRPPKELTATPPSDLSPLAAPATALGSFLLVVMWSLLILLILAVVVAIVRSVGSSDSLIQPSEPDAVVIDLETIEALPEPVRGVRDLLSEAERRAVQGAYGEAITFYYGWQLVQLDRQQLIEVQKGKTNRQYRREINVTKPELNDLFRDSIRLFEDAFFGKLPISQEAFEGVWTQRGKFDFVQRKAR